MSERCPECRGYTDDSTPVHIEPKRCECDVINALQWLTEACENENVVCRKRRHARRVLNQLDAN